MTFKETVHAQFSLVIQQKIIGLQQVLADLKESGTNETKSTAGDKHETALAMLQIEQANVRTQLSEALSVKAALEQINPSLSASVISKGSLVKTNKGYLFVSVALGKMVIDQQAVIALSPQSPLGKLLLGLNVGNVATVNAIEYRIESIE